MKDAASEANLTVVAIILIAVVVTVATPLVKSLMNRNAWKSCCSDAGGVVDGNNCVQINNDGSRGTSKPGKSMISEGQCQNFR